MKKDMIFLKSNLVRCGVTYCHLEWRDKGNMHWHTSPARSNVAHLVTSMYMARQCISVMPRAPT